jgi:hypothetical protein
VHDSPYWDEADYSVAVEILMLGWLGFREDSEFEHVRIVDWGLPIDVSFGASWDLV